MSKGEVRLCSRVRKWPTRVRKDRPPSRAGTLYGVWVNNVFYLLTCEAGIGTWVTAREVGTRRVRFSCPASMMRRGNYVVKKRQAAAPATAKHLAAMESVVFSKMHSIVAHCCATQYDDGEARRPGWITIKVMGSAWVIEAKDPDSSSCMRVVQQTLDDALALLSLLLESDDAPWEPDPWLQQQKAKESKKK